MTSEPTSHSPDLLVVGLGNVLRSDDGVGVHLVRALAQETWPPSVRIVDAGTPGLALLDLIEDADHVVILDACQLDAPPGTIRTFTPDEVRSRSEGTPLSVHQPDVLGALRLGEAVGVSVSVTLVGIQPAGLEPGTELSPALTEAFPELLARVSDLVAEMCRGSDLATDGDESIHHAGG